MTRAGLLLSTATVGVVAIYAGGSWVWTSRDPQWFASLPRPSWQPPDWVFGVVWPYNFLALIVVGLALASTRTPRVAGAWVGILAISVAIALAWAYLFYVPHALAAAAGCLAAAAMLTWVLEVLSWRAAPWMGWVLLPYAVWLSVATSLAVAYARTVPR